MEVVLLMRIADVMGFSWTVILVVFTGVVGASLARSQGLKVLAEMQRDMQEGRLPAPRLVDGVMILVAGVLLITPGVMTDGVDSSAFSSPGFSLVWRYSPWRDINARI